MLTSWGYNGGMLYGIMEYIIKNMISYDTWVCPTIGDTTIHKAF